MVEPSELLHSAAPLAPPVDVDAIRQRVRRRRQRRLSLRVGAVVAVAAVGVAIGLPRSRSHTVRVGVPGVTGDSRSLPSPAYSQTAAPLSPKTASPGDLRLVAPKTPVTPGQSVVLTVTGSNLAGDLRGDTDTLETRQHGRWRTIAVLGISRPGAAPQDHPAAWAGMSYLVGYQVRGPYNILVPDVPPGDYRVREDIELDVAHESNRQTTLYAPLTIAAASPEPSPPHASATPSISDFAGYVNTVAIGSYPTSFGGVDVSSGKTVVWGRVRPGQIGSQ